LPAPIAPGPVPGSPVTPAVVAGLPVTPGQPATAGQAVTAGFIPGREAKPSLKPTLPSGDPRIKVVAVVGAGNIITDEEVWESVHQRPMDYSTAVDGPNGKQLVRDPAKEKEIYAEELKRIIERELILDEMYTRLKKGKKGNVIDEIKEFAGKAADRQLQALRKRWKVESEDEFRSILTGQGLTLPVVRRQIERQMMAEEYVRSMLKEKGKSVGLSEIRDYYDKHPDDFRTTDRVKWLDIFVSYNKFPTQREAYDYATAVHQKAAAGADFAALSEQYDHGLAGQQKGPQKGVGLGQKRGEIQPADVEPTVWALQSGQVSGLIETPAGYHIVKVAERELAGVRPFGEDIQAEVRRKLLDKMHLQEHKRLVENLWWRGVVDVIEKPDLPGTESTAASPPGK
ncbi:MAG: hypothetical protein JWO38_1782, partial [Gemmataceae bacterium]|nr:hypothetical protein [Gemmataceae bacterium]